MKTDNTILNLTCDFSIQIIELYKLLIKHNEYVISKQLLRSATSIGANVEEVNAAQTKKEFIQRMSIASKESRETKYWLRLLHRSQIVKYDYSEHLKKIDHIINILTKIVKTSQQSLTSSHTTFDLQHKKNEPVRGQ
ncbi:MAG TPA: four helix bundle protein [Chitinophagaceae bacterium]|nr:four helix bundle protein [Chitinophagaceae bacterium]